MLHMEVRNVERKYLVDLRSGRNESQQDVADGIGISRQYYAMIEDGSRQKQMDITLISKIAEHFSVPISQIVSAEMALAKQVERRQPE